jgi:type IV secretory pathway protease TraF
VRSGADEIEVVAVDFVEQEPIGFYVTISMVFPIAAQRMVFVSRRQGIAFDQEQNQRAQLGHFFSAPLGEFDITPKFGS